MNRCGWFVSLALVLLPSYLQAQTPLKLPPGLTQILPINKDASYVGDAIRVADCPRDEDNPFGACGNFLFGGLALMDSHLEGMIQIRFFPPVNNIAHFELTHPANLRGEDAVLKAPVFYELPVQENFIIDPIADVSSGDLNLLTGEVTNLRYTVLVFNSFYTAFQNVNPNLKASAFVFPGLYGSAKAEFQQRPDGLLDFTLTATTFLPLGNKILEDPVRMPLPFCGPLLQCGSIEAPGTSFHPHVRISTGPLSDPECGDNCPAISPNSVQLYTAYSYNTTLGDNFQLNAPELGGPAEARSHISGRIQIQFGERTGDFVPFSVSMLPPEALLAEPPGEAPFPGFSLGLLGQSEFLRFPKSTYFFRDVITADDPFEVAVGQLNLKTGHSVGDFNYRFIFSQNMFQAILEINPGLAPAAQVVRGPLSFEQGANGQTVFRYNGEILVSLPGIIFPRPDLNSGFATGPDSKFDVFLRLQAMHPVDPPRTTKSGSASNVLSSAGDLFSYNYFIRCNAPSEDASFEYTNNNPSNGGTFRMQSIAAVSCTNSRNSRAAPGDYDTVTFTGFGTWSKDSQPHAASVQFSVAPDSPYVYIMIDAGFTSQANTKPDATTFP
ncbi:MAG: hypothetical protein HY313_08020 [Acidobacteria bacterium]|nr:hypothetical protein [Acidobacteriota bacterium]